MDPIVLTPHTLPIQCEVSDEMKTWCELFVLPDYVVDGPATYSSTATIADAYKRACDDA